jgi:hypothetical protein
MQSVSGDWRIKSAGSQLDGPAASRTPRTLPILRLSAGPAKEPSGERTEYHPSFGRERNVGGHAYNDAEHYPDQRADANKGPRSPNVFPDSHTDHPRLPGNSRSRTQSPWCGLELDFAGALAEYRDGSERRYPVAGVDRATVTACALRADARKIGLAGVEDEPSGLCDSADLVPSLSGAVLRPSAPRERVPSLRHRSDAELRAGHRRKTPADRLHLGSIFSSRGGRRREARCLDASDVRLHPPLAGGSSSPSRSASRHPSRATIRP